jgi:4-oxalocrotonate tautomerase
MPIIRVEMWEGRSLEQKRRLAREVTDLVAEIIMCDPTTVRVLIDEYSRHDWAVGGQLQIDRETA